MIHEIPNRTFHFSGGNPVFPFHSQHDTRAIRMQLETTRVKERPEA